ncbi:hypothetical protein [Rhodoferax saidenbachensis]|uniref:Capsule polysaccharide biosynthesis protein n=1 Tax=Rhodoferax saidenbachensis TaxID=1484693 RepID=A0ABU1ZKG3_9BURK|nr:hypothetical protein [Rhodoferax saidenbachensis]MDR7306042.1 hypothetical protein [Rhodoferax saidenbachensis]
MSLNSSLRDVARSARSTGRLIALPFKRKTLEASTGLDRIDPQRPVYVFFAPEGGVPSHFVADCMIARTMQDLGHQVLMVRCFDSYHHCLTLESRGIPLDRSRTMRANACISCAESGKRMTDSYDLPTITLTDLLSPDELAEIKAQTRAMPADAGEFEVDGIRFGTLCGMDLALNTKKLDQLTVTGADRALLEAYVEAAITSYRATQQLIERYQVKSVLFFNEYSILMGAVAAAQKHDVPVVRMSHAIHRNIDRSKIILMADPLAIINYHRCLDNWPHWRSLSLPPKTVDLITDNQLSRMGASGFSVYSPKFTAGSSDVFSKLKLAEDRAVLVVYTSSLDEYFSNIHLMSSIGIDLFQKEQPFADQIEWIAALIGYVEKSSHLQLVVRIHPREGKTARENVASEHREMLVQRFSGQYQHVRIVWPEEPISSYDLAEIADIALTSWTNITSETTRLGVPTLIAFKRVNPFPVDDMVGWAPTPESYFELLEKTLKSPDSLDHVLYAYRWSHSAFLSCYVDVGDLVTCHDYDGLPPYQRPAAATLIERVVRDGASLQEMRYDELVGTQGPAAARAELSALKRALRRVLWFLASGTQLPEDYRLRVGSISDASPDEVVVDIRGAMVEISQRGHIIKKRSRAISRLAPLIAES